MVHPFSNLYKGFSEENVLKMTKKKGGKQKKRKKKHTKKRKTQKASFVFWGVSIFILLATYLKVAGDE